VYSPPTYNLKKDHYDLFFSTLGPRFMAGGDYNSKHTVWFSRITNTKGRELFNILQEKNYSFLTTGNSTYWPTDPTTNRTFKISSSQTEFLQHTPIYNVVTIYLQTTHQLHKQSVQALYTYNPFPGYTTHGPIRVTTALRYTTK
jgi:hypothetical protein